jgi:hypothetical protein
LSTKIPNSPICFSFPNNCWIIKVSTPLKSPSIVRMKLL